jgi:hypothetical protein
MDTRNHQNTDNLLKRIDEMPILSPKDIARVLALYIKVLHDLGVVSNVSLKYIEDYDGGAFHRKFRRHFDQMNELFLRNAIDEDGRRTVLRRSAKRALCLPRNAAEMKWLSGVVMSETNVLRREIRLRSARKTLVDRFKTAVKKYLHLTWQTGFSVPSECVRSLVDRHELDKYVLSGDFSVLLLPFLPEIEGRIRKVYERSQIQDAWEIFKGRYYDHQEQFHTMAVEIKAEFHKIVGNFSDYFDELYTNVYYNLMIGKRKAEKDNST